MNKRILLVIVAIAVIVVLFLVMMKDNNKTQVNNIPEIKSNVIADSEVSDVSPVKEFSMTSFVEMVDGQPKPQYSLKEITVNKGDRVRIKITVTSGMHDFKIDEYGIYADTQLNKESVVEFVADKAGEFTYYCTKPGHRQNGHFGTLKVLE